MACMFNRNLFICVEQEGEGRGGGREKAERKEKKNNNMKMDGPLVMQMKDNIIYKAEA